MLMERVAEIVRGWPYDGSLDRAEPIKAGATLVNGDWVTKQADGTVDKTAAAAAALAGLVIVGNGDSASASNANEAVVLWSNFIAKIANYDNTATYAPGSPVTVKSGKITLGVAGTDPILGYVLNVQAAATGLNPQTAHLVVLVK